ncbi:hypothetical protein FB451DRAFT_1161242 [Mycena latifolia]|nr:hypothetical protein FB451DRAFT_1161242 [Mycena latifolia]
MASTWLFAWKKGLAGVVPAPWAFMHEKRTVRELGTGRTLGRKIQLDQDKGNAAFMASAPSNGIWQWTLTQSPSPPASPKMSWTWEKAASKMSNSSGWARALSERQARWLGVQWTMRSAVMECHHRPQRQPSLKPLSRSRHLPSSQPMYGFTPSYLRRVPELALMTKRVVKVEAKRRTREARKKALASGGGVIVVSKAMRNDRGSSIRV